MNKLNRFSTWPVLMRVAAYLLGNYGLIFGAQVLTGRFSASALGLPFNAALVLLLVLFTHWILRLSHCSWSDIGLLPPGRGEGRRLLLGTLAGLVLLVLTAGFMKLLTGFHWQWNPAFRPATLLLLVPSVFLSVFAQELAFRGYPFQLLLRKWGEWPAQLLIAFLFGLMHLSEGMNIESILLTLLTTGMGSLLFGVAVIRTRGLALAVGLHFGWNLLQVLLPRAAEQNGPGIWIVSGGNFHIPGFLGLLPYLLIITGAYVLLRPKGDKRNSKPAGLFQSSNC